ncbi:MAG: tRNA (N6-threonylcarbamoyladenosine(37)-N6)-methyltransferase TrmO [Marinibacterium sp.]
MTQTPQDIRADEIAVPLDPPGDASLYFIGRVHTPWAHRSDCPRQGRLDGPPCRVEIFDPWVEGLAGLSGFARVDLLYWLDQSRRDLVVQAPRHADGPRGTFALRSPVRPNPIGLSKVDLVSVDGNILTVRGLDCVSGTPLIDIKPDRCWHSAPGS